MKSLLLTGLLLVSFRVGADPIPESWNEDRLAGFAEHKSANAVQDRERMKGQTADTEEREEWERARKAALAEHKKQVKKLAPQDGGPEQKSDEEKKIAQKKEYEKIRAEYSRRKALADQRHHEKRSVSEAEELGLNVLRPRYDVKGRVLYGAKSKIKSGGPSSGGYVGGGGGGGNNNFPPPPSFDEFPPGDGYVPPPMPEDSGDFPPPPPPAMPMDEGGMGGEFPPPPPPPDFGDFPPPPPPMPAEGF